MGRTLHQRVPLKSKSALFDLGSSQMTLAGVSALLCVTVVAFYLLF